MNKNVRHSLGTFVLIVWLAVACLPFFHVATLKLPHTKNAIKRMSHDVSQHIFVYTVYSCVLFFLLASPHDSKNQ